MEEKTLNRYWDTVVDIIHDGVMMVDPGGIIVSINPAFTVMTVYVRDELIGRNCSVLKCSSCEEIYDTTNQHWCLLFRNNAQMPFNQERRHAYACHEKHLGVAR
jgi:PAS domain S-box-containing protein